MKNFNYYAPTQVAFGRNIENKVAELVKKNMEVQRFCQLTFSTFSFGK